MKRLVLHDLSLNNESIAGIASCADKTEELGLYARDLPMHGWEILSSAINNRPTTVS